MAKKVSRKELKEPDEFVTFTHRVLQWVIEQRSVLLIGASTLALAIIGTFAWNWYSESAEMAASIALMKARQIFTAPVVEHNEEQGTKLENGTYASEAEKYQAAIAELEQVRKNHAGTRTANLALYSIGECYLRLGENDKAIEYLNQYLKQEGPNGELAVFAVEGIGMALEAQGKPEPAMQQYRRLTETPFNIEPDRGMYHLARLEQKAGRLEAAARLFRELLEKYPQTAFREEIQDRLSQLPKTDQKTTGQPGKEGPSAEGKTQASAPQEEKKQAESSEKSSSEGAP